MAQWIEVFGRLHPVVLHLPIGLLVGLGALELFAAIRRKPLPPDLTAALVWISAAAAGMAAVTGFTLGSEDRYEGATIDRHRVLGIAVAVGALGTALLYTWARSRWAYRPALVLVLGLLVPAGHLGATMTHGEGYLTSPLSKPSGDSTYAQVIAPLFAKRCASCHGESKQENDLALHTPEAIAKAKLDEIVRRVRLPLADGDHMPPKKKPQPKPEELDALAAWIAAGAPFTGRVEVPVEIPTASPAALEAFQRRLVHVQPAEAGSRTLWIDFAAVPQIEDAEVVALLEPVRAQAADVSLARCKVGDRALEAAARLPNLRRLNLRATAVTDAGVALLKGHRKLEELNLAQTKLTDASVDHVLAMAALRRVHLWRAGITPEGAKRLREKRPDLSVEMDDRPPAAGDVEPEIKLGGGPPATGPQPNLVPVNKACPVTGKAVDPKFAIVFRGRVVGFC